MDVRTAQSAELTAPVLAATRRLLAEAFAGEFTDDDWEHALGGFHAYVLEDGAVIGHVAVVERRLLHRDRWICTGYVEGLAVRPDRRRRGIASALTTEAEQVITNGYELGALSDGTGIEGFYARRGWLPWQGHTFVIAPEGLRRTPDDDDALLVFRTPTSPELDLDDDIACEWRSGDVW